MRHFVSRLGLFLLLQAIPLALLAGLRQPDPDRFFARAPAKHARLLDAPPPRLLIVGGSGVAFGFDSDILRRDLGVTPVNMGLHAGLGIDVILGETERGVRAGDVVVVSLEYDHFRSDVTWEVVWELLDYRPDCWHEFGWPTWKLLSDTAHQQLFARARAGLRRGLGREAAARLEMPYRREAFNEWGDVVGHWSLPNRDVRSGRLLSGATRTTALQLARPIERLNEFAATCRARGALVLWSFPAVPEECLAQSREPVGRIERALRERCIIPILDTPDEAALPLARFYDTTYHLDRAGAVARSERLASLLAERLDR